MATTDNKRPKAPATTKPYEPTQSEQAVIDAYLARGREKLSAPRMKVVEKNGSSVVTADHPVDAIGQLLIMERLGVKDEDFFHGILTQLANVGSHGQKADESG